ncbi:hypothetical protein [Trinickia dinghuensis]|uniref:hypothetical protein n=1 Tax=Trinickia dinghuensis TaxID=2291023 RepID=UPI0011C05CF9|nr:hypothetical protein [Trinickia dinghuensis]
MTVALQFSLNRMSAPRLPFAEFLLLSRQLEVGAIEIRNDLPGVEIVDGTSPLEIREMGEEAGIEILTINDASSHEYRRRGESARARGTGDAILAAGLSLWPWRR